MSPFFVTLTSFPGLSACLLILNGKRVKIHFKGGGGWLYKNEIWKSKKCVTIYEKVII